MIAFFQTGFLSMVPHLCRALVAPLVGLVGHVMLHTPYQMPIYFNIHTHQHHIITITTRCMTSSQRQELVILLSRFIYPNINFSGS